MRETSPNPYQTRQRWHDNSGNPWDITLEISNLDGQLALTGITIRPLHPGYRLTQRTVRQIPITDLERTALATQAAHLATFTPPAESAPHSGRTLSDSELKLVADIYRTAERARLPVQRTVAETLGIPLATATRRIMVARQKGFLPPAPRKGKTHE